MAAKFVPACLHFRIQTMQSMSVRYTVEKLKSLDRHADNVGLSLASEKWLKSCTSYSTQLRLAHDEGSLWAFNFRSFPKMSHEGHFVSRRCLQCMRMTHSWEVVTFNFKKLVNILFPYHDLSTMLRFPVLAFLAGQPSPTTRINYK